MEEILSKKEFYANDITKITYVRTPNEVRIELKESINDFTYYLKHDDIYTAVFHSDNDDKYGDDYDKYFDFIHQINFIKYGEEKEEKKTYIKKNLKNPLPEQYNYYELEEIMEKVDGGEFTKWKYRFLFNLICALVKKTGWVIK